MTRQYELVERILSYQPSANEGLLNRAYVYAMKAHGNQKRASGAPYFSHPLEVAAILADMRLDDATIATALLHDTIEDTEATRAEIDALFGAEIGTLVDGLTKIKKLDLVTKKAEQAENFRKLLLAISSDIRVLLVKLADRLHNMRTLEHMKPGKRKTIAEETMDIYAPLAGRMGMQWLREELEDLSFRWLNPEAYATVSERLKALRQDNQGLIDEIEGALKSKLKAARVAAVVAGREKKPYAIWSKMERKQISLEQLSDIYAFRIVVPKVPDCYRALAVVHTSWHTVPGRFKDYISNPKQNDYQSIHTTIVGPKHQRVELQIRTDEMHSIAEYGVAAHALYKESGSGKRVPAQDSSAYRWLTHLVGVLLEGDNPEEFLEHTKLELFHDQVFCFTPKGRLIALPRGANCIDFAYLWALDPDCADLAGRKSSALRVADLDRGLGDRVPDRSDAVVFGDTDVRYRTGLGEAVAVEQRDSESDEARVDVARKCSAARHREAESPAGRHRANLGQQHSGVHGVGQAGEQAGLSAANLRRGAQCGLEHRTGEARAFLRGCDESVVDHLPDAWYSSEDVRAVLRNVVLQAPSIGVEQSATIGQADVVDRALVHVPCRQRGEDDVVGLEAEDALHVADVG